jgi:CubicO group peptidase (beta-lactamase class C family)
MSDATNTLPRGGAAWAAIILAGAGLFLIAPMWAQSSAPAKLDAQASDPRLLGWMVGAPPAPDRIVAFADDSWYRFPQTRWSFSHIRQLMPTRVVGRGSGAPSAFPRSERSDIDAVTFKPIGRDDPMTWEQSLAANYTDGIVVLHRGRIAYERYFGVSAPDRPHMAFSVTKSFVATVAAMLIAEGKLDAGATVGRYLPELKDSGIGDATIRELLDMTTGLDYTEDYADLKSPLWDLARAGGWLARPAGYAGPGSFFDYLRTLRKGRPHGGQFAYKTVNTDALGAVLRRITGQPVSDLLSERIFSRLGAEQDAFFVVDPTGVEFAGGGLNLTLRDLARFGEMMRLDGRFNGEQIVPRAVIDDIRGGGNPELLKKAGYRTLPGGSYRTMWWLLHNAHGAYSARGIHGQAVYIDPKAEMVIARFASHHLGANSNYDATSLPAYQAVAELLMSTPR